MPISTTTLATHQVFDFETRPATTQDIGFVYELMRRHMEERFQQIPEGWSRKKFKQGYDPDRITIIQHEDMPIGFFDAEHIQDKLYVHNLHISDDYKGKGIGRAIIQKIEKKAIENNIPKIKAKIFVENERFLRFLLHKMQYKVVQELPDENSYLIEKGLKE